MYLPAYYPDLNPSENVFFCIKHRLNNIRPRAAMDSIKKNNILNVIDSLGISTIIIVLSGKKLMK